MRLRETIVALALALLAMPGAAAAQGHDDRARIAYSHDGRIYSIEADGSGRRLLVGSPRRGARYVYGQPAYSPDGRSLVYVRAPASLDGDDGSQLMIRDARGTRALTLLRKNGGEGAPAWSPDGSTIAFSELSEARSSAETAIGTIGADGRGRRLVRRQPLGPSQREIGEPVWAPGGRIAYTDAEPDHSGTLRTSIYTIRPDGSDARLLVTGASSPTWSPDGSRMALVSGRDHNGEYCSDDGCTIRGEVYVAAADGRGARRLTHDRGDETAPRWSPGGSRILFTSTRNDPEGESTEELYSMTPGGSCLTWLTNGAPSSQEGTWQPGSGAREDAGGCGAVGRRPLVETVPRHAARSGLWLGQAYRGLLLTSYERRDRGSFDYSDCGRFRAQDCPAHVILTTASVCSKTAFELFRLEDTQRLAHLRGGLAAYAGDVLSEFHAGGSELSLQFDGKTNRARLASVIRGLRRFGAPWHPARRFSAPRIGPAYLLRLRRAVAARRRYGSVRAAARAQQIHVRTERRRLRAARVLAPLRRARCR